MARSIIVTGGFGALGQAVAQAFAAAGENIARIDFAAEPRATIAASLDLGGIDLTDAAATAAAIDKVVAAHGGIDVLVNIAGGFAWEPLAGGSVATWSRMQAMNLTSTVTITQLALPHLGKSEAGRIVNIGAGAAIKAGAGMGAYAASKSGVHRLTEALAEELGPHGVTVNAVLPSVIDTAANRADMPAADFSSWVQPAAIAEVILFLASPVIARRLIFGARILFEACSVPLPRGSGTEQASKSALRAFPNRR